MNLAATTAEPDQVHLVGRIPVRNLWLLLLYASDLGKFFGKFDAEVEESPDLPTLIGRLLAHAVEHRLRRNLSRGYKQKQANLNRVRGRIDLLETFSKELLQRGQVACRFEEHTIDTPRNRLVRAALDAVANRVDDDVLAHRCRMLAGDLGRLGVSGCRPSRSEMISDQIARHDSEDLLMVTLSRIVFDLVLPTEDEGDYSLSRFAKDEVFVRKLFERAVGNFYASELTPDTGWKVYQGQRLEWPLEQASSGIPAILPGMKTDIVLENRKARRRIVIDTKFTGIFASTAYRAAVLKSGYIYQIYAYLRSQEDNEFGKNAEGMLLHPAIGRDVDEIVQIQGHRIRFVTVDLTKRSDAILSRLRSFPYNI
ncbi:5-methylcytosine-specific restriction endonuclease system specificity protein McrC [Desulfuromonas sp. TF]|uniref:5-methylcytosine-specific restriction endonuclease system specificity protein McrC n=1 Tax=Desulfuromonas sp. TF TaxID=1232410 RepID=UPI000402AEB6|nr:5-methylcytosine-specific restriction endonuclease system specificity protein McrC [Desulfuromonas sp. TF]